MPKLPETNFNYSVDVMLSHLGDTLYCYNCKRTGHNIKSRRGGIRLHSEEGSKSIVGRANKILKEHGIVEKELIGSIHDQPTVVK